MPIFRSIHHKYDFVGRGPVPRPSPHTILLDEVPVPRPSPHTILLDEVPVPRPSPHLEERTTLAAVPRPVPPTPPTSVSDLQGVQRAGPYHLLKHCFVQSWRLHAAQQSNQPGRV